MTWQRALRLLTRTMTWKEVAAAMRVTKHAVHMWFGFMRGHDWGWQPSARHKARLIRLAREEIVGDGDQFHRDASGRFATVPRDETAEAEPEATQ